MNFKNLFKDPHFSSIVFEIEKAIHEIDDNLVDSGVPLTDTNVKSCLQKAMGHAKGKKPSFPESNEKEKGMKRMATALIELEEALMEGGEHSESVTKKDWILCLKATEDSLKTRKEMYGHSRGYLNFLKGFIEEGKQL